jgi:hypothetical protein
VKVREVSSTPSAADGVAAAAPQHAQQQDEEVVDSEAGAGRAATTAGRIAHNIDLAFENRLQELKAYRLQHGQKCAKSV